MQNILYTKTMIFMIKVISNLTYSTMNSFKTPLRSANADRSTHTQSSRSGRLRCALRRVIMLWVLLGSIIPAMAQKQYVFMRNNNSTTYYYANGGTWSNTNSFSPSYIWTINNNVPTNNNRYLIISRSGGMGNRKFTPSLSTSTSTTYTFTISDGSTIYHAYTSGNRYLTYNFGNLADNPTNTNRVVAYEVTTSSVSTTSTNPTINGADVLTATGNSNYTATGAAYREGGYTNYRFNNTDHFFNGNTAITPANATIGTATWSLTDNEYATIEATTGVVNVSSSPESDIQLTLTATVTVSGGTPAAPSGTTLTASKTITIQGTKPSAPTISVNGTTVTLTTDAIGTTSIRYTLNGTNPTVSTGTVYNGAIDLSSSATSPVTIKAVTVRNGNTSDVSEETATLTLPEPVITVNADAGTATISAAAGATIYYTTDGSIPTTSSSQYSGSLSGLAAMTTIQAIAVKDGWNNSPVASELVTIPSGVSGGTVTLFDYEDHNWTYYAGVDASVDGGNYNTNYQGKMYSPNPRNVKITYNGVNGVNGSSTAVKVSISETENKFIYYKTLEESSTSGEYKYQVISNPFSVRPSTGTGNNKRYYGFAGWKIVSGGDYIKNHNNGDVLGLDEEIVFNNLPYPSVNCTSAEIVFETTWTQANVQTGNNIGTMLGNFNGGTYETNFAVLTGNYTTAWTGNKNATITSVLPDGSADYRGAYTRLNVTVSSGYTIKYEYININNDNSTLSMGTGTKTLYIGRGVSNTTANGVVCNLIQGCNGTISSGGLTYTLKIESGVYNYLSFTRGYDGGAQTNTITGTVSMKSVLGCDYDRAKGDNSKLKIQQQIMLGYTNSGTQVLRSPAAGDEVLNVTMKSGSLNSSLTSAGTADAKQSFYIGIGGEYSPGARVFTMEGGEIWNLAAGICKNTENTNSVRFRIKGGLIKGSIYGSAANANSYGYKQMIITGGQIKGWIAGGGNGTSANGGTTTGSSYIYVGGNARVDSEGSNTKINSSLGGQVFGSGSGVENTTTWGEMLHGSNVVIADNAYIERNAFGGGNFGWTDEYATIYLTGDKMSVGNVYGGANQNKGDNVRIYMTGGTVREGLYGGSNTSGTINYNVEMHINGGQVGSPNSPANIHGGGFGQPTRVSRNVEITLGTTNQTTPGVTVYGDVYGGSALGYVNGTTAADTYHTYVTLNKGTINGSLYGGGLGNNNTAANVYGPVQVKVYGGSVRKTDANGANGSGGVYGANNVNGAPQRAVTVDIYGTDAAPSENEYALYAVYGGGNAADYTYGNGYPTVTVHNCDNSIEYVYGGGNAAAVASTNVTIYGGDVIGNVFGGGNGTVTAANVTGNTVTNIYGGTIGRVFGGSNSQGTIGGTITVNAQSKTEQGSSRCPIKVGELYGGGNMANSNAGAISIGCMEDGDMIDYVYGGANQANINGNINLTMTGGRIGNLFGGNNTSGNISGTIAVTVNWNGSCDDTSYLGNVFGGGNQAAYSGTPTVTITNGTVSHSVYGGGNEAGVAGGSVTMNGGSVLEGIYGGCNTSGTVSGVIAVTINAGTVGQNATNTANVHGGGFGASTATGDNVTVTIGNGSSTPTIWGDVYGGSALGNVNDAVTETTKVWLKSGTVNGCLYGGGLGDADNAALVNGKVQVIVDGGAVKSTTNTGRTTGNVFGCNNVNGTPKGTVEVEINTTAASTGSGENKAYALQGVYGGGNLAHYNPTTTSADYPKVTVACGTSVKDVYGGGNAAATPNTNVIIEGGDIDRVFAGGNGESGTPANVGYMNTDSNPTSGNYGTGNAKATINGGTINQIFGGSNANGVIRGTMTVDVEKDGTCAMVIKEIYGGGNMAASGPGTVNISCTGTSQTDYIDYVYGGANQANITGDITLNITGGRINNVFGGNNTSGVIDGDITVNVDWSQGSCTGNYLGNVFGGGNLAEYSQKTAGHPAVNIKHATVSHSVYGGGKGSSAVVTGNPIVTIGDNNAQHVAIVTENVYGGGDAAAVTGNTSVTYNDNNANSTVANLFGGGNAAGVSGTATVTLTSGKVLTGVYGGCNASGKVDGAIALNINGGQVGTDATHKAYGIFGGGKGQATQTGDAVTVTIGTATNAQTYPTIYGDVYGGSAEGQVNDAIGEITKVWLKKGVINGDLYGGGFGDNEANALVNGGVQVVVDGGTVTGKVFGCNNANGTPKGAVTVTINGTDTPQSGYALSEVYGGGNMADYVPTSVTPATVVVNGCNNSIGVVYGGGNAADVLGTDVTIWGGTIGQVFGGGHGNKDAQPATEANVVKREDQGGNVAVKIYGGTITEVFGGSNSKGTIQGASTVTIQDNGGSCTFAITDVYGGGNQAEGNAGTLAIGCGAVITGNVYGGAKAADVNNDIHLVITGGTLHNVFGGNNVSGTIAGTITIDIDQDDACTTWHVDNVYGGGNLAAYSKSGANYPEVNIKNGAVSGNVFGGGYGESARVTANPHVNLIGGTITGNVFGGGEAAPVTGSPVVTANYGQAANIYGGGLGSTAVVTGSPAVIISKTQNETLTLTDVFGGGDAAAVTGSTAVTLTDGTVRNIYGGGNAAGVSQTVAVTINGGTVTTGVYGGCNACGTIGTDITLGLNGGTIGIANGTTNIVFGGGYGAGTSTNGNITVNVNGSTIHGHVYGGSALGSVNDAAADATTVNVLAGTVNGNIYGGGLGEAGAANVAKGQVNGTVTVNIGATDGAQTPTYSGSATINGSVYGCNNTNGSPKANVFVNVYKTAHTEAANGYAIDQVFGGGNQADYSPTSNDSRTTVHIYTCDNTIRRVFAGGNAAAAIGVANIIDGGRFEYVYGGGNGEVAPANIGAGGTNLQVHGGNITYLFGGSNHSGTITGQMRVSVDGEGACAQDMYIAEFFCGNNEAPINTSIVAEIGCGTRFGDVYGGCNQADITGNVTLTIKGGEMNNVYGGSKGSNTTAADITGNVTLNIYGGNINNDAFGGSNINGNITGNIIVNMDWSQASENCNSESDLHVRNVFGASNLAAYTPTNASGNYPQVNIIHGTVSGSVFGAGNGDPNDPTKGIVTSNPVVTIGDAVAGHYVVVAENVYGGGNNASVTGSTSVTYNDNNASSTVAKLFGGGNAAGVTGAAAVTLTNGKVTGGVYGGCNSSGTIGGNALVTVTGGTVGANAAHANIHGGGYGQQTAVSGDVTVNIGQSNSTAGATIYGDVYGGSALGTVNTDHSGGGTYNKTAVNLYGGTIDGNVYGGGLGDANTAALVYGDVDVFQYGAILIARYSQGLPSSGMIFGCNNVNGTPKGHVKVGVYKTTQTTNQVRSSAEKRATHTESDHTYEMSAVFGGGNQAAYIPDNLTTGSTEVFINGCDDVSIHSVYGGGNAASTPATLVTIQGAYEIEYVFGGGNGAGTGNPGANVGYHAYNAGDPAIGGPSDEAKAARQSYAYGSGEAKTQIYGGRLHKVFGGSNTLGNVREATVAMLDEISDCQLVLDGIYGGGKSAYMEGNAEIELGCVSGIDEIYGGAEQADVGKSIVLTLTSGHYNKVYGGNNLGGKIMGSITVNIEQTGCLPLEIGELYLGGNNAPYSVYGYNNDGTIKTEGTRIYDQPVMNLKSFKSIGTVFGGGQGESAVLAGDPTINVNVATGWVDGQYKGIGDQDPKSIYHATPQDLTPDGVIGTIFGGGNAADVIGNTNINIGNQATVEMHSLAVIKQKIQESANGQFTTGGMIFKLSDDEKSITYTVVGQTEPAMTKQIIQTVNGANITGNVYGGGNAAAVTGSTNIVLGKE